MSEILPSTIICPQNRGRLQNPNRRTGTFLRTPVEVGQISIIMWSSQERPCSAVRILQSAPVLGRAYNCRREDLRHAVYRRPGVPDVLRGARERVPSAADQRAGERPPG